MPTAKPDVPKMVIPAFQHDPPHKLKMLTEKHNDEKLVISLLIVGDGLLAYLFWCKINGIIIHNPQQNLQFCIQCNSVCGTNLAFSMLTDHGAKERKRHYLALEKLQKERDKWNEDRMKRLDFINKRLREKNDAKAYISKVDA